jgi:hypothetical protein
MNRAERRAIQFGRGRNEPMVEVVDCDSAVQYGFALGGGSHVLNPIFDSISSLFISRQVDPFDWQDDCLDYL